MKTKQLTTDIRHVELRTRQQVVSFITEDMIVPDHMYHVLHHLMRASELMRDAEQGKEIRWKNADPNQD